jgi:hypothetical protein
LRDVPQVTVVAAWKNEMELHMKTRKVTSIIGLGVAMVGMLAIMSPVPGLANSGQIKVTHAGSMTTPVQTVQATPAVAKSFQVGLLAPASKGAKAAAPQRVSKYIHR